MIILLQIYESIIESLLAISITLLALLFVGQFKTNGTNAELLKVHADFHKALLNNDTDLIRDILADEIEFVIKGQVELLSKDDYLTKREEVLKKIILVDFNRCKKI